MSDWQISLSDLNFGPEEEEAVQRVVRSRWLSMGPEVAAFEQEFASLVGVRHAFAVANGTAALHLALLALEIGPGDEVVQPAVNFVASANMTKAIGATPVFAEIVALDEPTLDPEDLARKLTDRTRAVIVMHYGGYPCRMAEIRALCEDRGIAIIEDACHAVGARYEDPHGRAPHGLMAGALGDVACFSFFSNKNLATGEGGMVVSDRDDLAERLRRLRSHGMTTLTWDRHRGHASTYDVVLNGFNYRLDEMHGALGRVQLSRLPDGNRRRNELVAAYRDALAGLDGWTIPFASYRGDSACHLMTVVAPSVEAREMAAAALRAARIQTSLHYPYIPGFTAFAGDATEELPISRAYSERTMTLPLYPTLTREQVELVAAELIASRSGAGAETALEGAV